MSSVVQQVVRKFTGQPGVDERKVECVALFVARWARHRRRLDDALANGTRVLDVLELGGEDDGAGELRAAVDLEEVHDGGCGDLSEPFPTCP